MASEASKTTGSVQTVITALVYNGVFFLFFIILFLILRPKNRRIYEKRVHSVNKIQAPIPKPLSPGYFTWLKDLYARKDRQILREVGMDGYFFLRFLRLMFIIAAVGAIVLLPILLPVNATNGQGLTGLDQIAFGNISNHRRYYAHALLGWIFFGFVLFMIYRELMFYVATRQTVLTSEAQKHLLSSRTLLVTSIPKELLNESYLRELFEGVKHVSIGYDVAEIRKLVHERQKLANKLESTLNNYFKKAIKKRLQAERKAVKAGEIVPQPALLQDYAPKTPTHRLKFMRGEKVETIEYAKTRIAELNQEIEKMQAEVANCPKLAAAFVVFKTQKQAEIASQVLVHHTPLVLAPAYVGVRPDEVVWGNLSVGWQRRLLFKTGAMAFCMALVILWAIPVAFVGFISQISELIRLFPFLSFIKNLPDVLYGLISSLLPTIMLAVLMLLLPVMIRTAAKLSGLPTTVRIEYYTQNVYFAFQVVQVFIITTLSSSIISSLHDIIEDPTSILTLLRTQLPSASNFFINWTLLQALTIPAALIVQWLSVLLYYVLGFLLDGTPRKKWNRANIVDQFEWGTIIPVYTNMAVIMFSYAIIAPIILIFGATLFAFTYIAFLNNATFTAAPTHGRGIYHGRALRQLFVGIYLAEVCLILLFIFSKSWGPVVLQAILIAVTSWVNIQLREAFDGLLYSTPLSCMIEKDEADVKIVDSTSSQKTGAEDTFSGHTLEATSPAPTDLVTRFFKPHIWCTRENIRQHLLPDALLVDRTSDVCDSDLSVFDDPAITAKTPIVWFSRDPYGWAEQACSELRTAGVDASIEYAWYEVNNEKAKVKISCEIDETNVPIYSPEARV